MVIDSQRERDEPLTRTFLNSLHLSFSFLSFISLSLSHSGPSEFASDRRKRHCYRRSRLYGKDGSRRRGTRTSRAHPCVYIRSLYGCCVCITTSRLSFRFCLQELNTVVKTSRRDQLHFVSATSSECSLTRESVHTYIQRVCYTQKKNHERSCRLVDSRSGRRSGRRSLWCSRFLLHRSADHLKAL